MSKSLTVAVVGATGAVGREMLKTLHERNFPATEVRAFASARSAGSKVPYGDGELVVQELKEDVFDGIDIAIGDPEKPAILSLSLRSYTLKVEEYDDFEETTKYFYVDDQDWENALNDDPKAAQAVADEVAEQLPESLEIISRYMAHAASLGCKDAQDWLADYYRGDDGRYDAYA